ncbi:hypothetical protein FRB99_005154 [Tulasnella sp. 403]|nr:hypothetical protein FRB99_005154 [Tulasnella sp. 403]
MFPSSASSTASHSNLASPTRASFRATYASQQLPLAQFKALAIEGRVKEGDEGATLKLFAKISVPSHPPQQTYTLFKESNIVLRRHAVHPLNDQQVPYAFPPNASPLLHRAARTLGLKPVLEEYYPDALANARSLNAPTTPSRSTTSRNGDRDHTPAIIGDILVRNFAFTFMTPKYTIASSNDTSLPNGDADGSITEARSPFHRQGPFVSSSNSSYGGSGDGYSQPKKDCFYLIAMEIWVPFAGMPPDSPYMLYLPTPVCLSNKIKLRLPPITPSLLHDDDEPSWSIFTVPVVTPSQLGSPLRRRDSTASNENWADDEEGWSDAKEGDAVIEGTFPATGERGCFVVRWSHGGTTKAQPRMSTTAMPITPQSTRSRSNSMRSRRSNAVVKRKPLKVEQLFSSATYHVYPTEEFERASTNPGDTTVVYDQFVPVDVEFEARCLGLSHPGVETELALDVAFDRRSELADIQWNPESASDTAPPAGTSVNAMKWTVSGQSHEGFRGWQVVPVDVPERLPIPWKSPPLGRDGSDSSLGIGAAAAESSEGKERLPPARTNSLGTSVLSRQDTLEDSNVRWPLPRHDGLGAGGSQFETRSLLDEELGPVPPSPQVTAESLSRESSMTTSSEYAGMGPLTRSGSNESGASFSQASSSLAAVLSDSDLDPNAMSGFTVPPSGQPCDPMLLYLDILGPLSTQPLANPRTAEFRFNIKGRLLIPVPESAEGNRASIPVPLFRLSGAADHQCNLRIISSVTTQTDEALVARFEGGNAAVIPLGGEQARLMSVSAQLHSLFQEPRPAEVMLSVPLRLSPRTRRKNRGGSLFSSVRNGLAFAAQSTPVRSIHSVVRSTNGFPLDSNLTVQGEHEYDPAERLEMPSMPSPDASYHTGVPASTQLSSTPIPRTPMTGSVDPRDAASISLVKVKVRPWNSKSEPKTPTTARTPRRTGEPSSCSVRLKVSWPSRPSGDLLESIDLQFTKLDSKGRPTRVSVRSAKIDGIPLVLQYRDDAVSEKPAGPSLPLSSSNAGLSVQPATERQNWIKLSLPKGYSGLDGQLEVNYIVHREHAIPEKSSSFEGLLPRFTISVTRMEVAVQSYPGFDFRDLHTDLQPQPSSLGSFVGVHLPANHLPRLSFTLRKPSYASRLVPSLGATMQGLHYVLTIALLAIVWMLLQEVQGLRHALPVTAPSYPRFSFLSDLVDRTTAPFYHVKDGSDMHSATASRVSASTTSSLVPTSTRKAPKATYVPPDDLWGGWDASMPGPFLTATEEDSIATLPEKLGDSDKPSTKDSNEWYPKLIGSWHTLTLSPSSHDRILCAAEGLARKAYATLVDVFHPAN